MTIDQMIVEATEAADALRLANRFQARAGIPPLPDPLRPRRGRHRADRIALSPLEFIIAGTASALLGGIFTYGLILVSAGWS